MTTAQDSELMNALAAVPVRPTTAVEWQTLLLILGTYSAWLALTSLYGEWPLVLVAPALAVLVTLHSSLQHETIHGHPTRSAWLNGALVFLPLSLWLPYPIYRHNHLKHHDDDRLTDPLDDPESYYWTPEAWQAASPAMRVLYRAQQTLAGRLLIGSWWRIGRFLWAECRGLWRAEPNRRRTWALQLLASVPVVAWLTRVCGMPLWLYVVAVVVPANGILLIRSFAEHRALPAARQRIAIVEGSRLLGPLFLFNNLHALHHAAPAIPWYQYNGVYRHARQALIASNGGLLYRGYADVARQFLFRAHDVLPHPHGRIPTV